MQKSLVQMNLQLPTVVRDITGVTGLSIVRDIIAGQTGPQVLALLLHRTTAAAPYKLSYDAANASHRSDEAVNVARSRSSARFPKS